MLHAPRKLFLTLPGLLSSLKQRHKFLFICIKAQCNSNSQMDHQLEALLQNARAIFNAAVQSVQPQAMIRSALKVCGDILHVGDKQYKLNKNCHVVGFGKAVQGMAVEVEGILRHHLVSGIISIPHRMDKIAGARQTNSNGKIQVMTGAENNIPDEKAFEAAKRIVELASSLQKDDILIVLISGGGSALLPYPSPPITLDEKSHLIRLLSKAGATIWELNTVRKQLSKVKGGGLAKMAGSSSVVALILSDVIGDPLDFIASGPTVPNLDPPESALNILEKYGLQSQVAESILQHLQSAAKNQDEPEQGDEGFQRVQNMLIGNNQMALEAAQRAAIQLGFISVIASNKIQGEASIIGQHYAELLAEAAVFFHADCNGKRKSWCHIEATLQNINVPSEGVKSALERCAEGKKTLCLILGGEPTVTVRGNGLGGRNQELLLSCGIRLELLQSVIHGCTIAALSAGTDGYDGPTDAAGAVTFPRQMQEAETERLNSQQFLARNDSFSFYSALQDGRYLVKTGHTGTNVMDVHILLLKPFDIKVCAKL